MSRYGKYEKAKEAIEKWRDLCEQLETQNIELEERFLQAEKEIKKLREYINTLPDPEVFEQNKETIKQLRKKLNEQEELNKDKINSLTRDKILLEGRIQHLEESRKDLQERYAELKQDFRDFQKK